MLILLPVDASPESHDAVRHAVHLRQAGLPLQAVLANVQEAPHLYEVVLTRDPDVLDQASERAGRHALQPAQALLDQAGIPATQVIGHGDPGRVLVEIAEQEGCEGIILSAGRPGVLDGGRLGSVAQAVVHHARIPVTLVHHPEPEDAEAVGEGP